VIYFFIFNLLSTKHWTLKVKKHKITHYAKDVICLILAKFIKDFPIYQQLFYILLLRCLKNVKIYTGKHNCVLWRSLLHN